MLESLFLAKSLKTANMFQLSGLHQGSNQHHM